MIIKVTQEDIDAGIKSSCIRCPVALAISRSSGFRYEIHVSKTTAKFYNDEYYWVGRSIDFPKEVTDFIRNFDSGKLVEPFEFEINVDFS